MVKKNIGESQVITFAVPPAGFDPLIAKPEDLKKHGIAPRPNVKKSPHLDKLWNKIYSKKLHFIIPEFEIKANAKRKPNNKKGIKNTSSTSNNWSGSVVIAPMEDCFNWIIGSWTVPHPCAPKNGSFYSCAWVGIDGEVSTDVLQAGTQHEVKCVKGVSKQNIYLWWEWYPDVEMMISNFPVSSGDVICCLILADIKSKTKATIYVANLNTAGHTSFTVTAKKGTTLTGNCAEWIMERPEINKGTLPGLPDYGDVFFFNSYAKTVKGKQMKAGDGKMISMLNGKKIISVARKVADDVVQCSNV